jgi:hypothetical protein
LVEPCAAVHAQAVNQNYRFTAAVNLVEHLYIANSGSGHSASFPLQQQCPYFASVSLN